MSLNSNDMVKDLFKWFNRKKQAQAMRINETRLYRFTAGDIEQLTPEQIKEYRALLKENADEALAYLDGILETKTLQ